MKTWRVLNRETKIQFVELGLSKRQLEIAEVCLNFCDRSEICNYLGIDQGGLKFHLSKIYATFNLKDFPHFYFHFMPMSELTWIGSDNVDSSLLNPLPTGIAK
jgi:DNA-binding CsgD family transcriptional regulator